MSCQQNSVMLGHRCWWPKKDCFHINKVPSQSKGSRRHRTPVTYVARILNKNPWTYCTSISFTFIPLKNKNSWTYCTSITFTLLGIFWKRKNYYMTAICSRVFKNLPKDYTCAICSWVFIMFAKRSYLCNVSVPFQIVKLTPHLNPIWPK